MQVVLPLTFYSREHTTFFFSPHLSSFVMEAGESGDGSLEGLFSEPSGFLRERPTEPKSDSYTLMSGLTLSLRVVAHSSLWGNYLWNASRIASDILQSRRWINDHSRVLELGAGVGLPSIVATLLGAPYVLVTDYPEDQLIENIKTNFVSNGLSETLEDGRVEVMGYVWGEKSIFDLPKFDLILLCDLIFNHAEHDALLETCENCLSDDGKVLVTFTHHRPLRAEKDMRFLSKAEERGFVVTHDGDVTMKPMFPEDTGSVDMRSTVHVYLLTRHHLTDQSE
eukprot:TRINITY_DN24490_c0_g1_i1.p1 TRINITY_DN24490_c0_g1~~TRINITY_DN24490_c0_g1_i1.p1  ORF type:complete len:281 (+),score=56.42 TRINITY_DN24490_c0_g1_i1:1-843(+)